MWTVSLYNLHNWQNYSAFSHGNLSKIFSTIQNSANAVSANTFLSRDKCLECLPSLFTYSCQTICKTRDRFINWTCGKLSHIFSNATFNSETVLGFGWRFQNSFMLRLPDMIYPFHSKIGELLGGHCSFSITYGQLSQTHCWETRAMRAEPHAPRWICRSVWQQSVALFNEFWEQKLINSFNYCLQQH